MIFEDMDGRSRTRKSDLFDRSDADVRPTPGILYPDDEEGENEAHTNRLPAVDNGFNTLKTFVIFAIIVGCFAVVYPKFIHPVVLYAWGKSTQDKVTEEKFLPPRFQQGSVHPGAAPRVPRSNMHDRPSHHPGSRFTGEHGHVPDSKSSLYIMLPLYTVGIVAFLLYTFYKVLSRQPNPCLLRPTLPDKNKQGDLHHKSSRQQTTSDNPAHPFTDKEEDEENKSKKARKKRRENLEKNLEVPDSEAETTKITEFQLQALENKLKETEAQMNALIAQMALVKAVEVKLTEREAEFDEADSEDAEDRESDADEVGIDEGLSELRLVPGGFEESEEVVKEVAGNLGIMSDKTLDRENTLADSDAKVEPEKEGKNQETFTAHDNKEN